MSDTEQDYFESIEPENEQEPASKPKPAKKKRVLTEEQRQRNIENLRRGRAKALENRKKKAELKVLEKKNMEKNMEKRLKALKTEYTPVPKDESENDNNKRLVDELKTLRDELKALKIKPEPTKPIDIPKPEPTPPKAETPQPKVEPEVKSRPHRVPVSQMLSSFYDF